MSHFEMRYVLIEFIAANIFLNQVVKLSMHEKRSLLVTWHPTAHNILASAGADNMIFIWKVDSAEGKIFLLIFIRRFLPTIS